jgi:7-carboxy-7-deazaguanine synthase
MKYKLNDLYPTIQGEGAQTGTPMVLIRLQGCGVGCPFCDTKETWQSDPAHQVERFALAAGTNPKWCEADGTTIAGLARAAAPHFSWALITGGEPAEQDLAPLVRSLHAQHMRVSLETSGTALGHLGADFDWVCVSPKLNMPGGKPVVIDAIRHADEIKMVVGKQADLDRLDAWLPDVHAGTKYRGRPPVISLQPVSQSVGATELCVRTAMQRGWHVSLQQHKTLGVR